MFYKESQYVMVPAEVTDVSQSPLPSHYVSPKLEMQGRKIKMSQGSVSAGRLYENQLTYFRDLEGQQSIVKVDSWRHTVAHWTGERVYILSLGHFDWSMKQTDTQGLETMQTRGG